MRSVAAIAALVIAIAACSSQAPTTGCGLCALYPTLVVTGLVRASAFPLAGVPVGNPATMFPPSAHDDIWAVQRVLDFPRTVYGVDRLPDGGVDMRVVTKRAVTAARRSRWTRLDE